MSLLSETVAEHVLPTISSVAVAVSPAVADWIEEIDIPIVLVQTS